MCLVVSNANACPEIVGTWRSSKELNMEYNLKNVEMKSDTIKFLNDVLGILTPVKGVRVKGWIQVGWIQVVSAPLNECGMPRFAHPPSLCVQNLVN
jgi:hypothetical protein